MAEGKDSESKDHEESLTATSVYDFTAKDIDGNEVSLSRYRGKVLVIVNVACN